MIDVDEVLDSATAETGLGDFGDGSFREGLEVLVASAAADADLNAIGDIVLRTTIADALRNRLHVVDWAKAHPEVRASPIEAPLMIVGMPRTGTTALSHLLAADPANRSLLAWEARDTIPPPAKDGYWDDPRFVAAREAPDGLAALNPEFRAIHHDPPDKPVECVTILTQTFASLQYSPMFVVPTYDRWLLSADLLPSYRYHQLVLQILQSGYPGRWQLKSPHHCLAVDTVRSVYPDARLIWTHRDPVRIMGSVCSLARSLSGSFTDVDHTAIFGPHWLELVGTLVDRILAFHTAHGDEPFAHVAYEQLVRDPVGAVRDMYAAFGLELTDEAAAAMRAHAAAEPQHKYGTHTYTLEDFGLTESTVRDRFAAYTDRFSSLL